MSLLFFILVLYLYEMRNCNSDCKDLTFDCLLIKQSIKLALEIQYRLIELGKTLFMFLKLSFNLPKRVTKWTQ